MALNTDSTDYLTVRRLWSIMSSFKDKIVTALGNKSDKSSTVSNVVWSSSKLTKTVNGTTTDVVSASTLKSAMSLNNVTNDAQVKRSEMGTASGVATLDANGIINTSQLPSYVDDVLEYSAKSQFPATGETGKIYVDTSTNLTWRWSGTTYVEISPSLALGETSSTAYRGDRGKIAYDHSQLTSGNPHNVTAADVKAVRYDTNAQGLTDTQKSNARTNISAQASLATQTAYTSKGSSTKVPQITTNTLGQVTGISEVNIAFPSGTQLVYDCGTGSTSTTDFDNALAAYNAGNWVIINKDSVIYYCVGTYNSGLRFKQIANESDLLKVRALTWTRGSAPTVGTTLEAALTSQIPDISGKVNKSGDTMSGDLTISKGANQGDTKFVASRTDTGTTGWFGVGDGGKNHGVYSESAYANTNNDVDKYTKGWIVRTDENGYSSLVGKVDGLFSKSFGDSDTLMGMKRCLLGYSFDLKDTYTHVSATAIIEARLYSAGVSGGSITMLFNASARGDVGSYYRLQVISYNNWNVNNVCPVLIVQQSLATSKRIYLGLVSGGPASTTLRTFSFSEIKVLPINGTAEFTWEFGWDTNDFNSNTMTMIKPYVYPRAQIGTAIGSSSSPLYVKNDGDFATANLIDRAVGVKDAGRADAPASSDATVKLGWSNSAVPACTPDGTSTYSAGQTVGTTKHLVTVYEYDGVAYYKDVQAANVKVGDSVKWGGYKIQVGSIGSDSSTIYFT